MKRAAEWLNTQQLCEVPCYCFQATFPLHQLFLEYWNLFHLFLVVVVNLTDIKPCYRNFHM